MIPVAFNATEKKWDKLETTDNKDNNWYKYYPASQVRGEDGKLVDNSESNWANAMTKNESYFVWIPRYAYRITYYESETSTTPTGYGVYDMSGNKVERTAAFNNTDESGYFSTYGWTDATGLTTSSSSTRYATKYENTTSSYYGNTVIYNYGKVGDATKEVNTGGAYSGTSTTTCNNWFSDYPNLAGSGTPFFVRGGRLFKKASNANDFATL